LPDLVAPHARQVADRWHLPKNLREMVEQLLARFTAQVRGVLQAAPEAGIVGAAALVPHPPPRDRTPPPGGTATPKDQARQEKQRARVERYEQVRELRTKGASLRQIERAMGLSRGCVLRYLRTDHCPDRNPGRKRPAQLDPFGQAIHAWIERVAKELWQHRSKGKRRSPG
jgi:hypothetical protein